MNTCCCKEKLEYYTQLLRVILLYMHLNNTNVRMKSLLVFEYMCTYGSSGEDAMKT